MNCSFIRVQYRLLLEVMEQLQFAEELKDSAHGDEGQAAFHVHRAVLALASPVFAALFTNGKVESSQNSIDLVEEEPGHACAVGQLLAGFYPYHCTAIDMANVRALLHLADKYQLRPRLREECEAFLMTQPASWDLALLVQRYTKHPGLLDRQAQWVATNVRKFRNACYGSESLAKLEAPILPRVVAHLAKLVHEIDPNPDSYTSATTNAKVVTSGQLRAVFPFH